MRCNKLLSRSDEARLIRAINAEAGRNAMGPEAALGASVAWEVAAWLEIAIAPSTSADRRLILPIPP